MSETDDRTIVQILVTDPVFVSLGWLFGVVMALLVVGLLLLVEHYAVARLSGLQEGAGKVVEVPSNKVDPANEGKLVYLKGDLHVQDPVKDPDFGISAPALKLGREVEIFQWKENKKEKEKGDKTVVSYTYAKEWSKDKPEQDFEDPKDHVNPKEVPYKLEYWPATKVKLGAFSLSPKQIDNFKITGPLEITQQILDSRPAELKGKGTVASNGKMFVSMTPGSTFENPAIGDLLIKYDIGQATSATVVAEQKGDSFEPHMSAGGTHVDIIEPGTLDKAQIFESAHKGNQTLNWGLRIIFIMLLAPALYLMFRPVALGSGVDLMKKRNNLAFLLFGSVSATFIIFAFVGVRWLIADPVFGLQMLGTGGAGLAILRWGLRRYDKSGTFTPTPQFTKEEIELFRKIALEPENVALRRDLAARLEKRKNPQGELMRISIEYEELPENDHRRRGLDERWMVLLRDYSDTLYLGLTRLGLRPYMGDTVYPHLWMNQGNIERVEIRKPKLLPKHAERLFQAAPGIREIEFRTMVWKKGGWKETLNEFDFPAIFALPQLEQLGILNMSSTRLTPQILGVIVQSPRLKNLKTLDISSNSLGVPGVEVLAKSSAMVQLSELNLSFNGLNDDGAKALVKWPQLSRLSSIDLSYNDLTHEGIRTLCESNQLAGLTTLDLRGNEIGPEGAAALAGCASLTKLSNLDLRGTNLGPEALQALGASPYLKNVTHLNLESNDIHAAGLSALIAGGCFGKLQELELSNTSLNDAGAELLSKWPGLASVTKLDLASNNLTGVGIKALAASPYVGNLKELILSNSEGGIGAARALVASETLTKLKTLRILNASLTLEGKQLLQVRFGEGVECDE